MLITIALLSILGQDAGPTAAQLSLVRQLVELTNTPSKPKLLQALAEPGELKFTLRSEGKFLEANDMWAGFYRNSGQLYTFGVDAPKEAKSTFLEPNVKSVMSQVAHLLALQGDTFDINVQAPSGNQTVVTVNPSIGGVPTTQSMFGAFDNRSGSLISVRCYPLLDYSKFKSFNITEAAAIESASSAYARCAPFANGFLLRCSKVIGTPMRADESIPRTNELTEEQISCIRGHIALPFYECIFIPDTANPADPETRQYVIVDGRNGRVMMIVRGQRRSSKPYSPSIKIPATLSGHVVGSKQVLEFKLSKRSLKEFPTGSDLPIISAKTVYSAKFDRDKSIMWLSFGDQWRGFAVGPKDKPLLEAALKVKRARFGSASPK